MRVDLSKYNNSWYDPGSSTVIRILWYFINVLFFQNPFSLSTKVKIFILRLFGANIGEGVIIKPSVNIKYPWNITIGNNSWIGEKVWLDSLATINIGNNVCLSQGVYLCTGNHSWSDPNFGLIILPIVVEDGAWVAAKSIVLPGVTIASHTVLTAGSVAASSTEPYTIYAGNPAQAKKKRIILNSEDQNKSL